MSERPPAVSVIIPTYNCARYLPEAIDSVLAQTYRDFEIIVVDDGSTDSTQEVLAPYGDQIRVIRQANAGRGAARNAGILAAQGEYIAFLDADDLWLPQKLERQMPLFGERPQIAWAYCDYRWFDERGVEERTVFQKRSLTHPPEGRMLLPLMRSEPTWTSTIVVRAVCFREVGLFDDSFTVAQDSDMWLRLACRFEAACTNEPLALRRRHAMSVTSLNPVGSSPIYRYHHWRLWRKFALCSVPGLPSGLRRQVRAMAHDRVAAAASRLGEAALAGGRVWEAHAWLLRAVAWTATGSANRRELVPWYVGQLLDSILPRSVMDTARRVRRLVAAHVSAHDRERVRRQANGPREVLHDE
jgi:glycosyltransferase involved in cell wall biosynthesis